MEQGNKDKKSGGNVLDHKKIPQALREAKIHRENGSIQAERKIYEDILDRFPKNKKAKQALESMDMNFKSSTLTGKTLPKEELGELLNDYKSGNYNLVVEKSRVLRKSIKPTIELLSLTGSAYFKLKKYEETVKIYKLIYKRQPNSYKAVLNIGVALKAMEKFEEACSYFKKAISMNNDLPEAHMNLGNVLRSLGNSSDAMKAYNRALELRPDYAEVYYNIGNAYKEMDKWSKAEESYAKALEFKPDYPSARHNLLQCQVDL